MYRRKHLRKRREAQEKEQQYERTWKKKALRRHARSGKRIDHMLEGCGEYREVPEPLEEGELRAMLYKKGVLK